MKEGTLGDIPQLKTECGTEWNGLELNSVN